jgi:hypothetical protein
MKKVVVASFLVCALAGSGARSAPAQQAVQLGTQPAGQIELSAAEAADYQAAQAATTPQAKAAAYESFLTKYPQSTVKPFALQELMISYSQIDPAKTLDAADRLLQVDPNNIRALVFEAYFRNAGADTITDPAAKQAALDAAAGFAQKGLVAPKPKDMSDADFKTVMASGTPIFYHAIGAAALNKKNTAGAIAAYKSELTSVPVDATKAPGQVLQDTYFLGIAYLQSTPPDLLNCAFYTARFVGFAPATFKTQYGGTPKYCYSKFHGADDGYDAFAAAALTSITPDPKLFASVTPAPTPAEKIHKIIVETPDLGTLAISDKELVFQYGSTDDATKVWDTVKGKSVAIPDALVIASTPTQIQVAVDPGMVVSKTADFTFNMKPIEEIPEPAASATPAAKAAYRAKVAAAKKEADAVAAATAVGSKVTLQGVYASYTANPLMITMSDGEVILPKPTKPVAKPAAPVHHTAPAHK